MTQNSKKWQGVTIKTYLRNIFYKRIIDGAPASIILKKKALGKVIDVIDIVNPIKDSNIEKKSTNRMTFHVNLFIKDCWWLEG